MDWADAAANEAAKAANLFALTNIIPALKSWCSAMIKHLSAALTE